MAAEDARYRQSSQYRLWSFSPAQLSAAREKTNALARANITDRLLSSTPSAPASGANTPDPLSLQQPQPANAAVPDFLTPAEELQMLTYCTSELIRAGIYYKFRAEIQATAAVFLRRFYVTNSIMTYPPREMLKTCLFFGSKAEGQYSSVEKIAEMFPNTTGEAVLAGEFLLCQGLRFAFDVKHPFRALEGAIMELRRYGDLDEQRITSAHVRAREILKFSPLMTDAYFHYTPSQIMLAALSLADQDLAERVIHETFHPAPPAAAQPQPRDNNRKAVAAAAAEDRARLLGVEMRDRVLEVVKSCREMLSQEPPERLKAYWETPELEQTTKLLNRKLKKCRDPDRWDLVALQKARREEGLRTEDDDDDGGGGLGTVGSDAVVFADADKRDAKRRKVNKGPQDPFGGPL